MPPTLVAVPMAISGLQFLISALLAISSKVILSTLLLDSAKTAITKILCKTLILEIVKTLEAKIKNANAPKITP
jgi:hypothetical protein